MSFPTLMASKLFPLRVLLSWRIGTASRLINFSDGGGEPSTQPFQPFLTATRFLRGFDTGGGVGLMSSSSSGVCGLLEDVRDVSIDVEGEGVGVEVNASGGGVTETDRCIVAM